MRISGIEPSLVILSKRKYFKKLKMYAQEIKDACLCLWLAETILTLSLQRNSASKISTSSIMFLSFSLIIYQNLILPF